jgi:hypothetical protein
MNRIAEGFMSSQAWQRLDRMHEMQAAQIRAEAEVAYHFVRDVEQGTLSAEDMDKALDYPSGPGTAEVIKVLSIAMASPDPIVALAARQLVERAAAKYAEHFTPEVDA